MDEKRCERDNQLNLNNEQGTENKMDNEKVMQSKFETSSEIGVAYGGEMLKAERRKLSEEEVKRIVGEARNRIIGFK